MFPKFKRKGCDTKHNLTQAKKWGCCFPLICKRSPETIGSFDKGLVISGGIPFPRTVHKPVASVRFPNIFCSFESITSRNVTIPVVSVWFGTSPWHFWQSAGTLVLQFESTALDCSWSSVVKDCSILFLEAFKWKIIKPYPEIMRITMSIIMPKIRVTASPCRLSFWAKCLCQRSPKLVMSQDTSGETHEPLFFSSY